jgi:hypothetical protein
VKRVQVYARELAGMMGLADWNVVVVLDEVSSDVLAAVECVYGQRFARVALCENWDELALDVQRDTLVHELVHAILSPYSQMAGDLIESFNSEGNEAMVAKAALGNVEEWVVDAIALAWGRHLPLPKGDVR